LDVVSRPSPSPNALARCAAVGVLATLAVACTQTLDAGRDKPRDACAMPDTAFAARCTPTGLLDNLVGYWRLDDGTGSTVAFDSSGRRNDGILHGLDASTAWVSGRSVGALDLAHAGWVEVAPSPSIDAITDHVTVSAWIKLESAISSDENWATALSRQTGTGVNQHYHLALYQEGRPSLFLITDSGYAVIRAGNAVPIGAWTHIAGVYDGAIAHLYVNGAEVASQELKGVFSADTTPVILGGNANNASGVPNELVPGRIDELMLYARALSAAEIGELVAGALFPPGARDAATD